jgi:hypothetical protein
MNVLENVSAGNRAIACLLFLGLATACAKSNSQGSLSSDAPVAVTSFSAQPSGEFTAAGEATPGKNPQRFAQGCANAGAEIPGKASFDARLKVGQKFSFQVQDSYSDGTLEAMMSEAVTNVSESKLIAEGSVVVTNGTSGNTGGNYTKTCTIERPTGSEQVRCAWTPQTKTKDYTHCSVITQDADIHETLGTYRFKNGAQIKAFKAVQIKKGQVMCQKTPGGAPTFMADGIETSIRVYSNDVIANTPLVCGGSVVFDYRQVQLKTGELLNSERTEMVGSPN